MIPLALSILASTFIFVLFRLFSRYAINTLQAIVVNYFVACSCGIIGYQNSIELSAILNYDWFYFTLALGALFIIVFNLITGPVLSFVILFVLRAYRRKSQGIDTP